VTHGGLEPSTPGFHLSTNLVLGFLIYHDTRKLVSDTFRAPKPCGVKAKRRIQILSIPLVERGV
jgi:hypothetical protein